MWRLAALDCYSFNISLLSIVKEDSTKISKSNVCLDFLETKAFET